MDLKGALLPPLIALAIYFFFVYFLVPLYRKRHNYSPSFLPGDQAPSEGPAFFSRTRQRVHEAVADFFGHRIQWAHRRTSLASADFNLGDEELEEGLVIEHLPRNAEDRGPERRLSRELEAGFRDDSESEEEDDRGRGRSRG